MAMVLPTALLTFNRNQSIPRSFKKKTKKKTLRNMFFFIKFDDLDAAITTNQQTGGHCEL